MNFKELRQKYPDYNDMSDQQFADAFHAKYYSDLPKEDFYKKLDFKQNQPKVDQPKGKTSITEDAKIGLAGAVTTLGKYGGGLALAGLDLLGQQKTAEDLYSKMQTGSESLQKWANPEGKEQGLSGKIISAIPQIPTFPFSTTGQTLIEKGEDLPTALKGTAIDVAGNLLGAVVPGAVGTKALTKFGTGAAINAAQDVATKKAIQSISSTTEAKKAFEPTLEDALASGVIGGGFSLLGKSGKQAKAETDKLAKARAAFDEQSKAKQVEVPEVKPDNLAELQKRVDEVRPMQEAFNRMSEEELQAYRESQIQEGPVDKQMDLPFDAGPEEIAFRRSQQEPQMDLFAEDIQRNPIEQVPDRSVPPNPQMDLLPDQSMLERRWQDVPQEPTVDVQRQIEEAYAQRRQQQAEEQQQKALEEGLMPLEERLREEAYQSPTREELRAARGRPYRNSQRGGIDLQAIQEGIANLRNKFKSEKVNELTGISYKDLDTQVTPEYVIDRALQYGKDTKGVTLAEAGSELTAVKRDSPLIRYATDFVKEPLKRAEQRVIKMITGHNGVEKHLRRLPTEELVSLSELFKDEMFGRRTFTKDQLDSSGFTSKQVEAYLKMREVFNDTYNVQNESRLKQGKEPITKLEYYSASSWQGDFRMPVYQTVLDKDGNPKIKDDGTLQKRLVWFLASDTKVGLNNQLKALQKSHPDLEAGKSFVKKSLRNSGDIESAYSLMLDVLDRNDPVVQKIQQIYELNKSNEANATLNQKVHFEDKGNIRGFIGDRPGMDKKKEALAFFQSQINYAKSAYRWAALQEASESLKPILSNAELNEKQPNNMKYLKEYWSQAVGMNESTVSKALNDALTDTGISAHFAQKAVGGVKGWFILQKLAFNTGFVASNVIQSLNVLPHLADLYYKGIKHNPAVSLGSGLIGGQVMAFSHLLTTYGRDAQGEGRLKAFPQFYQDAIKYAEENGVTSRSIYDESPIESSHSALGAVTNVAAKSISIPEIFVRSFAFMTYADALRQSGKYKDMKQLFMEAERKVNQSMVDYRDTERAMFFSKAGTIGDILNTLQTYPINYWQQQNYFIREAMKGNTLPLVSSLMLQGGLAGVMGIPFAQDIEKGITLVKDLLPTGMWMKVRGFDPKLWALENLGEAGVYGPLSSMSGVALTSRTQAPSGVEMIQAPGGPFVDAVKQVGSVGSALMDPTNSTKWAQAAMDIAPTGMSGALETGPLREMLSSQRADQGTGKPTVRSYIKPSDIAAREGSVTRTPEEESLRNLGLRSQREAVEKDLNWTLRRMENQDQKRSKSMVESYYDAVRRGDTADAKKYAEWYTKITGSSINDAMFEGQLMREKLTAWEKLQIQKTEKKATPQQLIDLARVRKLKESMDER